MRGVILIDNGIYYNKEDDTGKKKEFKKKKQYYKLNDFYVALKSKLVSRCNHII